MSDSEMMALIEFVRNECADICHESEFSAVILALISRMDCYALLQKYKGE